MMSRKWVCVQVYTYVRDNDSVMLCIIYVRMCIPTYVCTYVRYKFHISLPVVIVDCLNIMSETTTVKDLTCECAYMYTL